jgi:AAA family ATP:ADP antiporter
VLAWRAGQIPTTNAPSSAHERRTTPQRSEHAAPVGPYLLCLAGIVGLYEIVSTILDYQFTATVAHYLDGPAIGRQLSHAFALMNVTALLVQLLLTSPLLRKHGVPAALLVLPFTTLAAATGMMILPILPVASLIPALDSGFAYSIHQSAKEALYVPLGSGAQYGTKAFVDVFVMRGAKAVGVVLSFVITALVSDFSAVRWLSPAAIALIVPWLLLSLHAGRRFERLASPHGLGSELAVRRPVVS